MGCDIHAFYEVKVNDAWHMYKESDAGRDYLSFAILADVRNTYSLAPIDSPRGLPKDVSVIVQSISNDYGVDGHSHSYLQKDEFKIFDQRYIEERNKNQTYLRNERSFVFYDCLLEQDYFPDDFKDIRLVFFFDN